MLVGAFAAGLDPIGLILVVIAVSGLVFFGVAALRLRPRLAIGDNLLTVRTMSGQRSYTRDEVYRIRVLEMRHIGRRSSQLELDLVSTSTVDDPATEAPGDRRGDTAAGLPPEGSRLIVFGRWDLGADPRAVAQTLADAGFPVELSG
ncbi:PH domain-containing protein [Gordonia sp. X0973]|nr:PH domain-containing protein [Gordonia sp. X0973]